MIFAPKQKGKPMAQIRIPIIVNLPDDWVEQVLNRMRNDPESDWVDVIRCKDCIVNPICRFKTALGDDGYCSQGERRTDESD